MPQTPKPILTCVMHRKIVVVVLVPFFPMATALVSGLQKETFVPVDVAWMDVVTLLVHQQWVIVKGMRYAATVLEKAVLGPLSKDALQLVISLQIQHVLK